MAKQPKIELRNLQFEDYIGLKEAMDKAYTGLKEAAWNKTEIKQLLKHFPEGQLCILVDNKVAGAALSIIVDYKKFGDNHTYKQITGNYTFTTHAGNGDVLYGIDVFIHPEYRGMRLGRRLYDARKELCENMNLRAIMAGGRIPQYGKHAKKLTPRQYIDKVRSGEMHDPVLSFQLANDFHVKKILKNYLPDDLESKEFATLLEWDNIYYQEKEQFFNIQKSVVRIGLVQWQMRMFENMEALLDRVEYFVDAVSAYQSDFILFPEFFNAPLMAESDHLGESQSVRKLAEYTEAIRDKLCEYAVNYNVNIIGGSMPIIEDDQLLNISYLCRRDGTWDHYYKIHPTPSEVNDYGMVGGDKVKAMETDCGKIGVLICYDVEFPELGRILAEDGMQLLFVPFLTDTQNGYNRVRLCAHARAVENECYVAIAGSVGNLPKVNNLDIQYAQSAIFTPSDFAFPANCIKAEATPNTEMTIVADVDLDLLKELHEHGSVQNLKDRRTDLYKLALRKKKQ